MIARTSDDFCCEKLSALLREAKIALRYDRATRELGITGAQGQPYVQLVKFCPFCGTKQPASLREKWEERLDAIGYDWADLHTGNIPTPFDTDKWWKDE